MSKEQNRTQNQTKDQAQNIQGQNEQKNKKAQSNQNKR